MDIRELLPQTEEQNQEVTLVDLVGGEGDSLHKPLPAAYIRNKAAVLAALTTNNDPMGSYMDVLFEEERGFDITAQDIEAEVDQRINASMFDRGLKPIVADPTLTLEEKEAAINAYNTREKIEPVDALIQESLVSVSNPEDELSEEVRDTQVDLFGHISKNIHDMQAIINKAKLDIQENSSTAATVAGIAQEFIPLAEGIRTSRFNSALRERLGEESSLGDYMKSFFRPGASNEELREQFFELSTEDRVEFLQAVVDTVVENQGVIFTKNSQLLALSQLEKMVGEYTPTDASLDTAFQVLDMVGIGLALRAARRAGRTTEEVVEETLTPERTPSFTQEDFITDLPPTIPTVINKNQEEIDRLYEVKDALIADSSGILPRATVRNIESELAVLDEQYKELVSGIKEAGLGIQKERRVSRKEGQRLAQQEIAPNLEDIELKIQRLNQQLEMNRVGTKAEQKIAAIDRQISRLEKVPAEDGVIRLNPVADALYRARRNMVNEEPASVGSILFKTNPSKAKAAFTASIMDESGEVARALFQMEKEDLVSLVAAPRVVSRSQTTNAMPVGLVDDFEEYVEEIAKGAGNVTRGFTQDEISRGASTKLNDFKSPTTVRPVDGMNTFRFDEDSLSVEVAANYSKHGRPFSTAEEAVNTVKREFAEHGDVVVTPMVKSGTVYVETTLEQAKGVTGEFVGRISQKIPVTREDVINAGPLEELTKKWNFLDRVPSFVGTASGSLSRMWMSAGGIFDKTITSAANMTEGQSVRLEKLLHRRINEMAKTFKTLDKGKREQLSSYWLEANREGIALSETDLINRGFDNTMIGLAKKWRNFQDTLYQLENADLVKTLRLQGYKILDNGQDRFFAKEIPKDITRAKGYDVDSGQYVSITSRKELDELYDNGGYVAELRSPMNLEGVGEVENIVVRGKGSNYLRRLEDTDTVLNYRNGYFHVSYDAPLFIDAYNPKTGKTYTIATAKNKAQADDFIKEKAANDTEGIRYTSRPDKRRRGDNRDDVWDLNYQGGRIAQRRRGEALVEAKGSNRLEADANTKGPFESSMLAARSVATRTFYRDFLDNLKARAMQQHADVFPVKQGIVQFPKKVSDITYMGDPFHTKAKNARTDFEYINYLEQGYVNRLDDLSSTIARTLANRIGEVTSGKKGAETVGAVAERALHGTANVGVTGVVKTFAFTNMIVTNVFRQWIVQPAQLARLWYYDPKASLKGLATMFDYTWGLVTGKAATKTGQEFAEWSDSLGVLDTIDKSNLVRGTLLGSGEGVSAWDKTGGRVLSTIRQIGYDTGESLNMLGHMAVIFHRYKAQGKNVNNPLVKEEMMGKVRALSYDMSFEGDMPYNMNWMAMFTQFMQVPHKGVLQGFDRRLTKAERTRMVVGDLLMYGGLGYAFFNDKIHEWFGEEILSEDPEMAKFLTDGAMQYTLNKLLSEGLEQDIDLDFKGSLSPFEFGGYAQMIKDLVSDGGFLAAMENTPIGSLSLRDGNRVDNLVGSIGRWMGFIPDSELTPTRITDVLKDLGRMSSGFSNAEKALIALNTGEMYNKQGQVLVEGVPTAVAIAQVFGIPPTEIANFYNDAIELRADQERYEEAIRKSVKEVIRNVVRQTGTGLTNNQTMETVNALVMKAYRNDPRALEIYNEEVRYALRDPETDLLNKLYEQSVNLEIPTNLEVLERRLGAEGKQKLLEFRNMIKEMNEEN